MLSFIKCDRKQTIASLQRRKRQTRVSWTSEPADPSSSFFTWRNWNLGGGSGFPRMVGLACDCQDKFPGLLFRALVLDQLFLMWDLCVSFWCNWELVRNATFGVPFPSQLLKKTGVRYHFSMLSRVGDLKLRCIRVTQGGPSCSSVCVEAGVGSHQTVKAAMFNIKLTTWLSSCHWQLNPDSSVDMVNLASTWITGVSVSS